MAPQLEVILYLSVFVIVVLILIRMAMKARAVSATAEGGTESPHEQMLLKFVEDGNGKRIGETVAVEGDDFIVKDARGFLAVPTSQVSESGVGLRVSGSLDEAAAREKGEAWRAKSHKVISYAESELPQDDPEG